MLAKYIDENNVTFADSRQILKYADKQVINPREQDYLNAGYKPLTAGEKPAYDEEAQYLQPHYEEKDGEIVQSWEIKEFADTTESEE